MPHKNLIPLQISVKKTTWRYSDVNHQSSNADFQSIRNAVLESDDYTCRGCNFRSPPTKSGTSYMEVHHLDNNHANNQRSNLATLCPFCHQVFHIGFAGMSGSGVIIWLPEITQAELNNLCRSIFVAVTENAEILDERAADYRSYAGSARALYAALESRAMYVEEVFAQGASDPAFFGQALLDAKSDALDQRIIDGVRLLPTPGRFQEAIRHWMTTSYSSLPTSTWGSLVNQLVSQEAEV